MKAGRRWLDPVSCDDAPARFVLLSVKGQSRGCSLPVWQPGIMRRMAHPDFRVELTSGEWRLADGIWMDMVPVQ